MFTINVKINRTVLFIKRSLVRIFLFHWSLEHLIMLSSAGWIYIGFKTLENQQDVGTMEIIFNSVDPHLVDFYPDKLRNKR